MFNTPRIARFILILFIACIPFLVTKSLTHVLFNADLHDYVPTTLCQRYNDASMYWMQTKAFSEKGFYSGYFGREEDIARCPLIRFGWQNFISYAYGIPAYILGWNLWSSALWNPFILGVALFIFLWTVQYDWKRVLLTGLFVLTFWPLLFFLPTMMAEPFHYCIAFLAAAGFAQANGSGKKSSKWLAWLVMALLLFAAVSRPSWMPLLFLSSFLTLKGTKWKNYGFCACRGIILCAAAYGIFSLMMPDTSTYSASGAIMRGNFHLETIISNIYKNIQNLTDRDLYLITFRIQMGLLLVGSAIALFIEIWINNRRFKEWTQSIPDSLIHAFNFFSIVTLTLVAYTTSNWGDYRILSIYVLFSALLAIARWRSIAIPIFLIISNVLMTPIFIGQYRLYRGFEFSYDKTHLSGFSSKVSPHIRYSSDAEPWDNTLLYGGINNIFPTELVSLPAGIGTRIIIITNNLHLPIHSRYVLLDNDLFSSFFKKNEHLFLLTHTSIGNLYYCLHDKEPAFMHNGTMKGNLDNPDLTCWLGNFYLKWGDADSAIRYYQKALDRRPNMFEAICNLAMSYSLKGENDKALAFFRKGIEYYPNKPEIYYNISCIYSKTNRVNDSIIWLRKSIEKGFNDYDLIKNDLDLTNIRTSSSYKELIRNH